MPTQSRLLPPHQHKTQVQATTLSTRTYPHAPQRPPALALPSQTPNPHSHSQAPGKQKSTCSQHPSGSSHPAILFDNSTYQSPTQSSTSRNTSLALVRQTQRTRWARTPPPALRTAADTTSAALARVRRGLGARRRRLRSLERSLSRG